MKNDEFNSFNRPSSQEKVPIPMPFQSNTSGEPIPASITPKRRSKKFIIGIIIAVAVVILGAGSVFAYNFWYQNPEKVVGDSVMNAIKAKTLTFTGLMDITSAAAKVKVEIDGATDRTKGNVNVKATLDIGGRPVTVNGSGLIDNEGTLYFKIKNVKDVVKTYSGTILPGSQNVFDQLITKIDDRWVKISADDTKQFSDAIGKTQKCIGDTIKKFQSDKAAADEIANIYRKNKFLTIEQNLGTKDGSLGYTIKSDNEGAKGFARELKNTRIFKTLHDCDPSITIDENNIATSDAKTANETHMELWVNQWSHEITKFSTKDETGPEKRTFVFEPIFNKTVNITVPEKSMTIDELKTEIETLVQSVYAGMAKAQMPS
jgi:hypothetical protein